MKKKTMLRLLAAALLLMLISCLGAYAIQTDMGNIRVMDVKIPMPQGETLRVLIHKPASATRDNPAPCVITSHGYHATLETQDITSIELARRGFVVFNMDTYSAGDSSGTVEEYGYNRSYYGLGMLQLVDYVHDNIDYIDPDRIGITGHSTGGRNVAFTLDAYGRNGLHRTAGGWQRLHHQGQLRADSGLLPRPVSAEQPSQRRECGHQLCPL